MLKRELRKRKRLEAIKGLRLPWRGEVLKRDRLRGGGGGAEGRELERVSEKAVDAFTS